MADVNWSEKFGNRHWSKDFKAGFITKATYSAEDEIYRPCGDWTVAEFSSEAVAEQIGEETQTSVISALSL